MLACPPNRYPLQLYCNSVSDLMNDCACTLSTHHVFGNNLSKTTPLLHYRRSLIKWVYRLRYRLVNFRDCDVNLS